MSLQTAIQLLGGVGIFLYAIKLLSESLQAVADNKLRSIIATLTRTPVLGVIVGTIATIFLQSSSATTVMTISFVDAGLMTLKQAIGVIMGANIGTTVTGQIMAFKVKDFAYVFVIIGVILNLTTKSSAKKNLGLGILGFGLLFIGMQTMESAMYFLRERKDIFLMFADRPFLGLLAGAGLTLLVQSSSATMGITIALSAQGLMPLNAAMPIILGVNVGTTITAMLAAIGTSKPAKQASAAHVLFNLIAVLIFYPFMSLYVPLLEQTADSAAHQIANAHSLLNIVNTLLFLPFVNPFTRLIRFLIHDDTKAEKITNDNLDTTLIQTSYTDAIAALKGECNHMAQMTLKQLNSFEEVIFGNNIAQIEYIKSSEKELAILYKDINEYASRLTQASPPSELLTPIYESVSLANDLERITVKTSELVSFYGKSIASNKGFSAELRNTLHDMFIDTREVFLLSYFVLTDGTESTVKFESDTETLKENAKALTQRLKTKSYKALLLPELHNKTLSDKLEQAYIESVKTIERIAERANSWVN